MSLWNPTYQPLHLDVSLLFVATNHYHPGTQFFSMAVVINKSCRPPIEPAAAVLN